MICLVYAAPLDDLHICTIQYVPCVLEPLLSALLIVFRGARAAVVDPGTHWEIYLGNTSCYA